MVKDNLVHFYVRLIYYLAATESVSKTDNDKSRTKDAMQATANKTELPKSKEELPFA